MSIGKKLMFEAMENQEQEDYKKCKTCNLRLCGLEPTTCDYDLEKLEAEG